MWVQFPLFSQAFGVHVQTGEDRRPVRGGLRPPSAGSTSIAVRSTKTQPFLQVVGWVQRGVPGTSLGCEFKNGAPPPGHFSPPVFVGKCRAKWAAEKSVQNSCGIHARSHAFFHACSHAFFHACFHAPVQRPPRRGYGSVLGEGNKLCSICYVQVVAKPSSEAARCLGRKCGVFALKSLH